MRPFHSNSQGISAQVAGVLLASGLSLRFGGQNKLLAVIDGKSLVRRVAEAYLGAGLEPIIVVVGHQADRVAGALAGLDITIVENPEFAEGQSRALVRGVSAIPHVAAAVIGVADQPYLSSEIIGGLVSAWRASGAPAIAPRYGGQRGNPILYDRALFPELLQVTGDQGGRPVFQLYEGQAAYVDTNDVRQGMDIDTSEDYEALRDVPS